MADIELVIKIPEEYIGLIRKAVEVNCTAPPYFVVQALWESALNGIPLPKGHGRLIDADETLKAMDSWDKFGYSCHDMFRLTKDSEKDYVSYVHYADMVKAVNNAPTLIEADKGEEWRKLTPEEGEEWRKLTPEEMLRNGTGWFVEKR